MLPQLPSLARRTLPVVLLASVLAAAAWYARGPRPTTSRPADALGRRGIVFEGARTTAPLTLPAHASILTGLFPPGHGVRLNGVHRLPRAAPTLASLLQSAGYRTGAFVGAYVLDSRFGLDTGFDTYDDEIPKGEAATGSLEAERRGDVVASRAIAWVNALPRDDRPFLLWMHLYDPHAPYAPPAEWLAQAKGQAYDGEVAFADAQITALLDALRTAGRDDRTLIVVTGDHGESLGEHGEATHGMLLYEGALRVPLVFAAPGLPHAIRDDPASLVDIVPTVLGLLGVAAPAAQDGRDLLLAGTRAASSEVYAETEYPTAAGCSPLHALVDRRWKYIGGPAAPELYDLEQDPHEAADLASTRRQVVDAMGPRARAVAARATASEQAGPSAEVADRLRALGYVASAPTPRGAANSAPSPVTIVREWDRFLGALAELQGGHAWRAAETMATLVQERPDAPVFHETYARALADAGRTADALTAYRNALHRWPQDTALLHGLAVAARSAGLMDESMKAEQAVIAIDPTDAAAHNGLGLVFARTGRPADAQASFERAVALDPYAVSYWVNLGNARLTAARHAPAEAAYREALRLDPGSVDAANGLALLFIGTGRPAEAIPLLRNLTSAYPEFYEAWLNLGMAFHAAGDLARAADAYRHVLAAPPRYDAQRRAAAQYLATIPAVR
jgi:arylsulfatase A-like enzyme/Flp pilus assembly protein TadD